MTKATFSSNLMASGQGVAYMFYGFTQIKELAFLGGYHDNQTPLCSINSIG